MTWKIWYPTCQSIETWIDEFISTEVYWLVSAGIDPVRLSGHILSWHNIDILPHAHSKLGRGHSVAASNISIAKHIDLNATNKNTQAKRRSKIINHRMNYSINSNTFDIIALMDSSGNIFEVKSICHWACPSVVADISSPLETWHHH